LAFVSAIKDLFSPHAADYARFRPTYPAPLFAWLAQQAAASALAIDVGAGNGQAARALAEHFEHVLAIDPSEAQLANAPRHPRVESRVGRADATGADASSADLVVAAQAFHWFDQPAFFDEVRRIARAGAVLAVWCYALNRITSEIDAAVFELYEGYLGPYWEPERKLVEDGYRSVRFPFDEIACPEFDMRLTWSLADFAGYLGTWSPLQRYREDRGHDALERIAPRIEAAWGDAASREIIWPLVVRAFRVR
jgi:SAM-dependent methyltransferase